VNSLPTELQRCATFSKCRTKYLTPFREGELCPCFERARKKFLLEEAGIGEHFLSVERPRVFTGIDTNTTSIIIRSELIGSQIDLVSALLANDVSFTKRAVLAEYDYYADIVDYRYMYQPDSPELPMDVKRTLCTYDLVAIIGIGPWTRDSPQLRTLLSLRRRKTQKPIIFGLLSSLEELSLAVKATLSLYPEAIEVFE